MSKSEPGDEWDLKGIQGKGTGREKTQKHETTQKDSCVHSLEEPTL